MVIRRMCCSAAVSTQNTHTHTDIGVCRSMSREHIVDPPQRIRLKATESGPRFLLPSHPNNSFQKVVSARAQCCANTLTIYDPFLHTHATPSNFSVPRSHQASAAYIWPYSGPMAWRRKRIYKHTGTPCPVLCASTDTRFARSLHTHTEAYTRST